MQNLPTGTVTLLFTDIVGPTHLLTQQSDCYAQTLAEIREILRVAFRQWNGIVVNAQGEAFFAVFARATEAVQASVTAQRALASHAFPHGAMAQVCMGLHTGEPKRMPEGYVGLDVQRAARLVIAGHGGQILLSQTTCALVEQDLPEGVHLRDLGEHRLKNLGHPMRLFQLVIADFPADFPALHMSESFPNNLPVQPMPLLGREQEMAALAELLSRTDVHLVTLTGPGGTGKTRLALQMAADVSERFAHGVFFVNLAPISDPVLVVPTIAETLAIRERSGRALLERLMEELRPREMLLLLDNFEQVVSAAEQVAVLLAACPQLKVLVTSREVLHLRAEHEFPVPPLAVPDPDHLPDLARLSHQAAVALFLQQARAVKPDFHLTDANARAVASVCARLDGLPLAIELAAARMKLFSPQALLARLGQRFSLLTSASRDVPDRQQTLYNTIAWSYQLLDTQEQQLFRQLSVFVGGCSLEAIEAVCTPPGCTSTFILDGISSLVDKSLLQRVELHLGEEPRFMMLETLREYALQRLESHGEAKTACKAHAAYFLHLAEEAEQGMNGPRQAALLEHLEQEHDNLRAAMQWATSSIEEGNDMALRLGGALCSFWFVRAYASEGRDFLEHALMLAHEVAAEVRAKALYAASQLHIALGALDRAEECCEQSLALYRECADIRGIANSLHLLADVAWARGELTVSHALGEESLTLFRDLGDNRSIAYLLYHQGEVAIVQGRYTRVRDLLMESVAISRKLGDTRTLALSLFKLAQLYWLSEGNPGQVHPWLDESFALFKEVGNKERIANCFHLWAMLALSEGDMLGTASHIEQALALFQEIKQRDGIVRSLYVKAQMATVQQNYALSQMLYEQGVKLALELDDKLTIIPGLEGLAAAVAAQGNHVWAARLWGAAEALREEIGAPLPPVERVSYQQAVTASRTQLGEHALASAWAEGGSMLLEQALAKPGLEVLPVSTLGDWPLSSTTSSPSSNPDGLTAREVEVLRAVAEGLTNEQVAQRLIISPRTVDTHLTSIYSKISVSSRVAATRYAIEHHLI